MLLSSPPLRGLQLLGGGGSGRRDREGMGEGVGRKRFLEREGRREFESLHHACLRRRMDGRYRIFWTLVPSL